MTKRTAYLVYVLRHNAHQMTVRDYAANPCAKTDALNRLAFDRSCDAEYVWAMG